MAPSGVSNTRFFTGPQQALFTPSASPSVGPTDRPPTKRPRLRSTPSSAVSATPSTSNESTSSADVNSARRASTLRVLNVWAQLAERYNKRLDEDDIIDLYSGAIIKDRGVVRGASRDYHIGHFGQPDDDQDYPDADQEDSEQDDDDNELNAPLSEATTDDDAPISKKELLRGVPPLSATTDVEDLKDFMEAEKKRRVLAGEEEEEDMSPGELSALREMLEEHARQKETATTTQTQDEASAKPSPQPEVDATPTRPSIRVPPSDDESEDELATWTHDESTAVYPLARDESEQDVREVEREVIELTDSDSDSDSDAEFEALLILPPRSVRASPLPVPEKVQQPLQSPPHSDRGRPRSRARPRSNIKSTEGIRKPERGCSPLVPLKPEVTITHKRRPSVSRETGSVISDNGGSDEEVVGRKSLVHKGKSKEISPLAKESRREKMPKSLGAASRGRKRKRITSSSTTGGSLAQSPEPKSSLRTHGRPMSPSSISFPPPDGPTPTLDKDVSTPARLECTIAGPSRSLSSFSSASKAWLPTPAHRSAEPETVQPIPHDHSFETTLLSDPLTPVTHPYFQRHPSHPPSIFPSLNQGTPGLPLPGHPPQPLDPVQAQQAHLLLAQAMHQLSYLISATMPSYTAYSSNPGQPWHHPRPHDAYSTPTQHTPHFHDTRSYLTPSSSVPLSSPVRPPLPPPVEEQRARSRARSKSRGRRVSFKLDGEQAIGSREHSIQPELHNGQKPRKPAFEVKRERGKGKTPEELDDALRIEDGGSSSSAQEISRGRTPGPPDRKKTNVSRGRSLSRR